MEMSHKMISPVREMEYVQKEGLYIDRRHYLLFLVDKLHQGLDELCCSALPSPSDDLTTELCQIAAKPATEHKAYKHQCQHVHPHD